MLIGFSACSTATGESSSDPVTNSRFEARSAAIKQQPALADPAAEDARILTALWRERMATNNERSDFVLGPGDVLRIKLPQLENLKDDTVRISEDDTINLPLLGVVNVNDMTQEDLRRELAKRVTKYVYSPQVSVYLDHSENQLVAVLGAVKKPGRYMLTTNSETLMTMISRAGGTTKNAASRIIFIPTTFHKDAGSSVDGKVRATAMRVAGDHPAHNEASEGEIGESMKLTPAMLADGVVIDLSHPANQRYLAMPARSGDVIIVPTAGQVTVQGWVNRPGAFPITPGMTALGAIAAAGGALFTSSATLLRDQETGEKVAIHLNLSQIKAGAGPDVPVDSGDVIIVNRSIVGAVPYSLYFLIRHTGIGVPVMPF
jgi:polysaccharide export outer membrane protein